MHLPDGIIPLDQTIIYWIIALIAIGIFFYRFYKTKETESNKNKRLILTGVLTATAIVASVISIPTPFGIPMHLFLIPLIVIILGPTNGTIVAFLSLLIQSFIGFGGLVVLGANTVLMGVILPFTTYLIYWSVSKLNETVAIFTSTLIAIVTATIALIAMIVIAGAGTWETLLIGLLPFYIFIGILEGFITSFIFSFIEKIKPEILQINKI